MLTKLPALGGILAMLGAGCCDTIASWTFDDDTQSRAVDDGPHKLDGKITDAHHVEGAGGEGLALRFDSDAAKVDLPRAELCAFDSSRSFAVSFWIRTTQSTGFATALMTKDKPRGTVSYSFCLGREPGKLSFELWSWQTVRLLSRRSVSDGEWHYVAGAYDSESNQAFLFVDDEIQAAQTVGEGGPTQVILRIGNNIDAYQPLRGELDDVLIETGVPQDLVGIIERRKRWTLLQPEEITRAQQAYLDRMAAPRFLQAKSADQWREHAAEVREHVLTCLSLRPLPERLPLGAHTSGIIQRDDCTIKRIYWQTWPDYYASGYLFMPTRASFPAPGILCPHGHWTDGARNPTVQARCIALAAKGYVVLAVDSVHAYNWSAGLVPLTVMCWNNIRGIDLLCSLPEVDPSRLGCTGCSGGGQQTFYMMAIEDRIDVAIPVCMVSEFRRILAIDSHHCTCNHAPSLLAKTDTPELAACFAPRPSLLICVTQDWTSRLPEEGYPQIRGVYDLFAARDDVKCTQYDWPHDYSQPMREEAYAWFNQRLMGDDSAGANEPPAATETLEDLANLDGPPHGRAGPEVIVEDILARQGFDDSLPGEDVRARLAGIRRAFIALTHEAEVADSPGVRALGEPLEVDWFRVERMVIAGEEEVAIPAVVVTGEEQQDDVRRPAVILVDSRGKTDLLCARWNLIAEMADRGLVVCVADPRPFGELSVNRAAQDMNGVVFGRPELAVAAHDIKRVAEYLRSRADVDPTRVMCVGIADAAVAAIAAGLYDPALSRIAALEIGDTYAARDRRPRCPRILTVGDTPQLAACIAPRPLWIQGAQQPDAFGWTIEAYQRIGPANNLFMTGPEADDLDIAVWLSAGQ